MGYGGERTGLEDTQAGEVILVYKLHRLTRLHELMKLLDKRGGLFKSATEEINTTIRHGRLMIPWAPSTPSTTCGMK